VKVAATDTMTVFNIHSGYGVSKMRWRSARAWAPRPRTGCPRAESSSAFGLSAVVAIQ